MKFSWGMAALVGVGVTLAGPALAQSWSDRLPPGAKAAYDDTNRKCKDLAAPFKNGMLSGKFPFPDEDVTQQMLTNESYPTAAEAVVLHSYLEASTRCENLQRDFIVKYMPFDLKDAMFIYDAEQPVFSALMARKITYGKAARDIYNIESEGQARRKRDWPQALLQQAQDQHNAPIKAAFDEMNRKCRELVAPLRNGVLDGKTPLDGVPITPAMLAYNAVPSDAEAAALGELIAARQQCWAYRGGFAQVYAPGMRALYDAQAEAERSILSALAAKQMSFAQANQKLLALNNQAYAQAKALQADGARQPARPAAAVPSEQDVAGALH